MKFGTHFLNPEKLDPIKAEIYSKMQASLEKKAQGNNLLSPSVKNSRGQLYLYDVIDDYWGVGPKDFVRALQDVDTEVGSEAPLDIYIDCVGGDCWAARAIKAILDRRTADVTCYIDGIAASAATTIAMGGNSRIMAQGAQFMIHRCWAFVIGNCNDMEQAAKDCRAMDDNIVEDYVKVGNKTTDEFLAMMG